MRFVVLSDSNASDFVDRTPAPIFRDPVAGRPAWQAMEDGARKHDTFVYSQAGERVLFWDSSNENLSNWASDIRAAVVAAAP